jgi:hypothetical protein
MFLHNNGKVYFLFGDTYGSPGNPKGNKDWRSNTMAFTTDFDASDGITFNGWITDSKHWAKELVEGDKNKTPSLSEVTKIPTYGWSYQGKQYMWFMSVKDWGEAADWVVNYSEIAYSDNDGDTWTRSSIRWDDRSNFIQVAVVEHMGFLFFFGIPAGRYGGVKLARVLPSACLNKSAYQYYTGKGWSSNENDGTVIVKAPVGELSVIYNPYLQKWIMMYLNECKSCIEVREAMHLYGPWSDPTKVVSSDEYPGLYGAFMHDKYIEKNGEIVYFLMSRWNPYDVYLMKVTFSRQVSKKAELKTWDYWTHGVDVQIEKTYGNEGHGGAAQDIRRYAGGTIVRQDGGSSNWFHFAIPTPTVIDGNDLIKLKEVYVKANIGKNVRITNLHVWDGETRIFNKDNLNIIDKKLDLCGLVYELPDRKVYWGVVVSLGVAFLDGPIDTQEIDLIGAGVRFKE